MKLTVIGFGQAGGKILDKFRRFDKKHGYSISECCLAINSAEPDLMGLKNIHNKLLIGQTRVKGHGVGAKPDLGAEITKENMDEILRTLDNIPVHQTDGFLLMAGLGGGTGSGGLPILAEKLRNIYSEPIYALGILPSKEEGGIYSLNAARSFRTLVDNIDNLLLVDNESWRKSQETLKEGFQDINQKIIQRLGVLFGAGELESKNIPESVVDSSEIINTLEKGNISVIGYANEKVDNKNEYLGGFINKLKNSDGQIENSSRSTTRITNLIQKATMGTLSVPCDIKTSQSALLIVSGPSEYLDRKGIEKGTQWLENQIDSKEVRGGDYPVENSKHVACVLLLSGVTGIPRIKELQNMAIEAQEKNKEIKQNKEEKFQDLIEEGDELDPLR